MAYEDLKDAPVHDMDDIRPAEFYESMPMYAQPHALYRDDAAYDEPEETTDNQEQRRQIIAMVVLAGALLVALALVLLVVYGLISLNGSAAGTSSLSTGSLEL
jgi:hypothetical protein